jgi:hypothetical protein
VAWLWRENFPDGSWVDSPHFWVDTYVPAPPPPPTAIYADSNWYGGQEGTAGLVAAMRAARNAGLPLHVSGPWHLGGDIWIPDGVVVNAAANAAFYLYGARFRNADRWPATSMSASTGGYNGGGFTWSGGTFDGRGDGIFTLSHCPWATIQGATFHSWCTDTNKGHAIEINSSGGADNQLGEYEGFTIRILNNLFGGVNGQRAWSNDEPIQWDFAWNGSGKAGAEDFTMCHNVQIDGNTFHESYGGGPQHALCAIGAHDPGQTDIERLVSLGQWTSSDSPLERHNHFRISGNHIHGATGYAGNKLKFDKGAIHIHRTRQAWVTYNTFYGCTPNRQVSGWNSNDATQASSHTGGGGAHNRNPAGGYVWVAANASNNGGDPNRLHVGNA